MRKCQTYSLFKEGDEGDEDDGDEDEDEDNN
jgi:hypothetical protein